MYFVQTTILHVYFLFNRCLITEVVDWLMGLMETSAAYKSQVACFSNTYIYQLRYVLFLDGWNV